MSSFPPNSAPDFPQLAPPQPGTHKPKNRIGLIALTLSVSGLIFGIFPATSVLGWILLPAGFGAGIAGLFQKSKERVTSILAIVLSFLGTVICGIVLLVTAVLSASHQPAARQPASETEAESPVASSSLSAPALMQPADSSLASSSAQPSTTTTPSKAESQSKGNVPDGYENALAEARNYVKIMDFSYAGLYDQLTSEYGGKHSAEAAQYALDNLEVDWNAEALGAAQNYIDIMSFSYAGLYDQLTNEYGEQFTPEQAQYAVDQVKVDWNAEALESARSYMDLMDMSTDSLYDQLTSKHGEQFTPEQAQYAIDHL
ncbi:Ltp family lipoprotein [Rothia sp. P5766]|uniref:Ltp family lipoprotein n=1 Tax=Rothia sp. P5766 TaxID=3402656 RepID=UPI003AE06D7C